MTLRSLRNETFRGLGFRYRQMTKINLSPLPEDKLDFVVELLQDVQVRLERLEKRDTVHTVHLRHLHGEMLWLDSYLSETFPSWYDQTEEDDD